VTLRPDLFDKSLNTIGSVLLELILGMTIAFDVTKMVGRNRSSHVGDFGRAGIKKGVFHAVRYLRASKLYVRGYKKLSLSKWGGAY